MTNGRRNGGPRVQGYSIEQRETPQHTSFVCVIQEEAILNHHPYLG
jgi:hypothetical protein